MTDSPALIITGASRGLGAAMARLADRLGARSLLVARSAEPLERLAAELQNAVACPCDLSQPEQAQQLIKTAVERFDRLDALINNAGTIEPIQPLAQADPAAWAQAITVNLTSPALLMAAALPHLESTRGGLVNISTGAAVKVVQGWSAYCASKAGLLHLASVVAQEAPGVACFSLRPGVIDTQMQDEIRNSTGMTAQDLEKFHKLKSESQLEPPEVPARSALWLALQGPLERSGEFIQYTDPQVVAGASALFQDEGGSDRSEAKAGSAS